MHPVLIVGAIAGVGYLLKNIFSTEENKNIPARRIFISHSWERGDTEYKKFVSKLEEEKIEFYNHSIPKNNPVSASNKKQLENKFRKKMIYCSKIYILANSGISSESFVKLEIDIAKSLGKQIIAVKPHGQSSMPSFIRQNATKVISNNITSIIKSIKE